MSKREKRPSRLAWFALDVDSFLEDERTQTLTNREKSFWALMLIKSFRNKGIVITDPKIVSEITGATKTEAKTLVAKLLDTELLKPTDKVWKATSGRLQKEYETAEEAYERFSKLGKSSAEKNGANNLRLIK